MNQEIRYRGFTATPDDYQCADGELCACTNLIPENGALSPVMPPKAVMHVPSGFKALFIHTPASKKHYILYAASCGTLAWTDEADIDPDTLRLARPPRTLHEFGPGTEILDLSAIGNTLLAATSEGIFYFLWKESEYLDLGSRIPEIELSFGLVGHPRLFSVSDESKSMFKVSFNDIISPDVWDDFSDENTASITSQVMAKVNRFVAEQSAGKGRFCFPFFVRYATRLFDGSLVHHSAPVLMNPTTFAGPLLFWNYDEPKPQYSSAHCDIMLVAADLDWQLVPTPDSLQLDLWGDIITGVEIYVSTPLYTYDQSGECKRVKSSGIKFPSFVGRLFASNSAEGDPTPSKPEEDKLIGKYTDRRFMREYAEWSFDNIYAMYFSRDNNAAPLTLLELPEFSEDTARSRITSCADFHLLKTLDAKDLEKSRVSLKRLTLEIPEDTLPSLAARRAMTDDYRTHETLLASHAFAYNSRMNLAGIRRKPFAGFPAHSMFAHVTGRYVVGRRGSDNALDIRPLPGLSSACDLYVRLKDGSSTLLLKASSSSALPALSFFSPRHDTGAPGASGLLNVSHACYLYYPDASASEIIVSDPASGDTLTIPLTPHDFLNGAYALLDYGSVRAPSGTVPPVPSADRLLPAPGKLYTSEVNNPFFFPLNGINTVGSGEIHGICAAAKALSQGQFGQFPLYVFTSEGVWALEVMANGSYSARQPITRDVCVNPKGITQLDSSVLFPSRRGVMLLSGSQTDCISEAINSDRPFNPLLLPFFHQLHYSLTLPSEADMTLQPLSRFLHSCRMLYDYARQRVILFSPEVSYAYVYSLRSKAWGLIHSSIGLALNSYPDALALVENPDGSCSIMNYSEHADTQVHALYATRPLKLGAPDTLKTVRCVIQRGKFPRGHVGSVLYASRDLADWHLVWSSKDHYMRGFGGTPYKYFIIAGQASLAPGESIAGASVLFDARHTDQPR